ncbi:MAG: hypothetical protein HYW49_04340 [Deltaproteobacteria bacterium]|nr:hypothetical protein [Deltaproteobacteria bacterium]
MEPACRFRILAVVSLLGLAAGISRAHALESFPEFGTLEETEPDRFERPQGSEYQSDVLTYMKPEAWEYEWLTHPVAADFTVGSISPVNFLTGNRLKARGNLFNALEFRFTYFEERDQERDSAHHIPEFVFWPTARVGVSVFFEPSYYKRQDDLGLALLFRPNDRHELRVFNTWVDVTRAKRNDRGDTFDPGALPYARGIVGRAWDEEGGFTEYAVRQETRTRWRFPDQKLEYGYSKLFASLFARRKADGFFWSVRAQADRKLEARAPDGAGSAVTPEAWTNTRAFVIARAQIPGFGPHRDWEITPGAEIALLSWRTTGGDANTTDVLPHAWLKIPSFVSGRNSGYWNPGYEMTVHRPYGSEGVNPSDRSRLEHRFNLAYGVAFAESAELRLLGTADLDCAGSCTIWQGGDMQFRMSF